MDEKKGTMELKLTLYLEMDLDKEELQNLYNELEIRIHHKLVSDLKTEVIK